MKRTLPAGPCSGRGAAEQWLVTASAANPTGDRRPATGDRRPATGDRRPATGDRRPATNSRIDVQVWHSVR
ncbi:hypothetical protein KZ829_33265 [Actinoplanes hulinensis]|uniref:Uncharacterized protein n=1 Tax=Actinoplanes hulinensis TaxID=1144547 RepID=A0ABS7BCH8_9ACTN|nr:hypothetical protein [Actinoplanes hulinensis]MBW6438607.1 hypothetical protein [Actinoplanes hulinensis]